MDFTDDEGVDPSYIINDALADRAECLMELLHCYERSKKPESGHILLQAAEVMLGSIRDLAATSAIFPERPRASVH